MTTAPGTRAAITPAHQNDGPIAHAAAKPQPRT
jgi:hypothetical protein